MRPTGGVSPHHQAAHMIGSVIKRRDVLDGNIKIARNHLEKKKAVVVAARPVCLAALHGQETRIGGFIGLEGVTNIAGLGFPPGTSPKSR